MSGKPKLKARAVRAVDPAEHVGLVYKIAAQYARGRPEKFDDIAQEGMFGLIRAAELFEPGRGFTFSTYAVPWIRSYMRRFLRGRDSLIRISSRVWEERMKAREHTDELHLALDMTIPGGFEQHPFHDIVADERIESAEVTCDKAKRRAAVRRAIDSIRWAPRMRASTRIRMRRVLELAFFEELDGAKIGRRLGISRERVRQLLNDGLAFLRPRLEVWNETGS